METAAKRLKGKKKGSSKPLTFQDMMQIGLGQIRLSPSVFYEMTIQELVAAMHGAAEVEERGYQQQWTQTRWLASVLLQPHSKKNLKPKDLCIFPWEQSKGSGKTREEHNKAELIALQKIFKNGTA